VGGSLGAVACPEVAVLGVVAVVAPAGPVAVDPVVGVDCAGSVTVTVLVVLPQPASSHAEATHAARGARDRLLIRAFTAKAG
jgi:hypothetical protein